MFYKLVLILSLINFLPISLYITKLIILKKAKENAKKQEALLKSTEIINKINCNEKLKENYDKELKPLYEEARNLFNQQMKNKQLSHEQILYLENIIKDELGEYVHDYDNYSIIKNGEVQKGFKNDCHKIYVYMKSYHIDKSGWQRIINYLQTQ
mgnify:FL=1|jgi:hypothetical protein